MVFFIVLGLFFVVALFALYELGKIVSGIGLCKLSENKYNRYEIHWDEDSKSYEAKIYRGKRFGIRPTWGWFSFDGEYTFFTEDKEELKQVLKSSYNEYWRKNQRPDLVLVDSTDNPLPSVVNAINQEIKPASSNINSDIEDFKRQLKKLRLKLWNQKNHYQILILVQSKDQ